MGAWSEDNFGNDDAGDWMWDLEKSKGLDTLLASIQSVLSETDYLESPVCSEALAASEIIAAAVTGDKSSIPEEAINWLNKKQGFIFGSKPNIERAHAKQALEAVKKITLNSELQELWEEGGENKAWRAVQNTLIAKLENA